MLPRAASSMTCPAVRTTKSCPTVWSKTSSGGTRESVAHRRSGLLVDGPSELRDAIGALLVDGELRERLGEGAFAMSHQFTWQHAQESFTHVVAAALRGERVDAQDPDED